MAHDGVVRTASMSLGATESAMSSSEVRINLLHPFQYCIRFWVIYCWSAYALDHMTYIDL